MERQGFPSLSYQGVQAPSQDVTQASGASHGNYPMHEASTSRGTVPTTDYQQCEQHQDEAQDKCSSGAVTKKAILTADIALKIYSSRNSDKLFKTAESTVIARHFGISSKAVRDIWDRRTWAHVTMPLWTDEEKADYESMNKRAPGRPVGAKDSRPRKRRKDRKRSPSPGEGEGISIAFQNEEAADEMPRRAECEIAETKSEMFQPVYNEVVCQSSGIHNSTRQHSIVGLPNYDLNDAYCNAKTFNSANVNNFNTNELTSSCFEQTIEDATETEPAPGSDQGANRSLGHVVNDLDLTCSFLANQQDEQQTFLDSEGDEGDGYPSGGSNNSSPNPLQDSPEWFVQSSAEDIQAYVLKARSSDSNRFDVNSIVNISDATECDIDPDV
eukprot:437846-Hanusia_phi.AAC.2